MDTIKLLLVIMFLFSIGALADDLLDNSWGDNEKEDSLKYNAFENEWDYAGNTYPAQVFMGDVGSLALGGGLGMMAVCTKTELLSVIIGGLFVVETLSVITQVIPILFLFISGGSARGDSAVVYCQFRV